MSLPIPPSDVTLAAHIRANLEHLLHPKSSGTQHVPINQDARDFLIAANRYLMSEQQPPIEIDTITTIPENFAASVADALYVGPLRKSGTGFFDAQDTKDRVNSRARNQALADLNRAMSRYLALHEPPPATPLTDKEKGCRLWKFQPVKQPDGSYQNELTEVDQLDPREHAIIGLNGVFGMHQRTDYTKGFIRQIEKLLQQKDSILTSSDGKPIGIYVVTNPDRHPIHYGAEIPASNADPEHYVSPLTREFVYRVILPSIGFDEKTKDITLAQAKSALRKLNFCAYSQGSVYCRQIRNVLAEYLDQHGLASHEIGEALRQVIALHIAPMCRLDETRAAGEFPHGTFSNIYQISKNDHLARARVDHERFAPKDGKTPSLVPISDHELMLWDDTPVYIEASENFLPATSESGDAIYSAAAADHLPHTSSFQRNGHRFKVHVGTYNYRDVDPTGALQTITAIHDPVHLSMVLRKAASPDEPPADLSETLEPPRQAYPPDAAGDRPKLSETMKQAIRRFRDRFKEKEKG